MQGDPLQTQRNIEEFKNRRNRQLMASAPLLLLFIGLLWVSEHPSDLPAGLNAPVFGVVFIVAIVGLLIFSLKNWRCPACDRYLGKGFSPKFCPKCGAQLQQS